MPKDLIVSFGAQRGQEFGCCSNHSFGCLVHFGCSNHQEREILIFCKYTWFKSQSPSRFDLCSFLVRGWLIIMGKPLNKIDLKLHMIISSFSWPKMPIRLGPILYPWTTSVVQLPPPSSISILPTAAFSFAQMTACIALSPQLCRISEMENHNWARTAAEKSPRRELTFTLLDVLGHMDAQVYIYILFQHMSDGFCLEGFAIESGSLKFDFFRRIHMYADCLVRSYSISMLTT